MRHRLLDRPVMYLSVTLAALVILEAVFVPYEKPSFAWHYLPGYAALIGLGSCLTVVLASKALGRMLLQQPEHPEPSND